MKRLRLSDPKEIARGSKSRVTGSAFLHPDRGGVDNGSRATGGSRLKSAIVRQDSVWCGSVFRSGRGSFCNALLDSFRLTPARIVDVN
jgi:hypothetical protein